MEHPEKYLNKHLPAGAAHAGRVAARQRSKNIVLLDVVRSRRSPQLLFHQAKHKQEQNGCMVPCRGKMPAAKKAEAESKMQTGKQEEKYIE